MKVYIAGPMRGYPKFNFPAFDAARDVWKAAGWIVFSPADMDREMDGLAAEDPASVTKPFSHYMRRDITVLLEVDAIAFLPGWEASTGANVEKTVGMALDLDLYDAITFERLNPPSEREWNEPATLFNLLELSLEKANKRPAHHFLSATK